MLDLQLSIGFNYWAAAVWKCWNFVEEFKFQNIKLWIQLPFHQSCEQEGADPAGPGQGLQEGGGGGDHWQAGAREGQQVLDDNLMERVFNFVYTL